MPHSHLAPVAREEAREEDHGAGEDVARDEAGAVQVLLVLREHLEHGQAVQQPLEQHLLEYTEGAPASACMYCRTLL